MDNTLFAERLTIPIQIGTFCVHRLKIWVLDKKDITALFPYLCAYMGHRDTRCTEYYLRLTADLYPDIIHKTEIYFYGGDQDVK